MKWNQETGVLNLEHWDLVALEQCAETLHPKQNKNIPPLWSILSYAMYLNRTEDPNAIWATYRRIKDMAQNRDRYYSQMHVSKKDGGIRSISIPRSQMKQQQAYILDILMQLPVHECVFSYVPKRSMIACAKVHQNNPKLLVHMDIQNFFGSITEKMVAERLYAVTGYGKDLCYLMACLCCKNGTLPQGTSTSPALSNIVFYPLDQHLTELSKKCGYRYSRYSDDLYFSTKTEQDPRTLIIGVRTALKRYGFCLNDAKTRINRPHQRQAILSYTINEAVKVNRRYKRALQQELYYLQKFGANARGWRDATDPEVYLMQLLGRVSYVLSAEPENIPFLQAKQYLLEKLHEDNIPISVMDQIFKEDPETTLIWRNES